MVTTEKILQTMNSWQSGEVIAVRRKKCSGGSSRPNAEKLETLSHFEKWSEVKLIKISGFLNILCCVVVYSSSTSIDVGKNWGSLVVMLLTCAGAAAPPRPSWRPWPQDTGRSDSSSGWPPPDLAPGPGQAPQRRQTEWTWTASLWFNENLCVHVWVYRELEKIRKVESIQRSGLSRRYIS